MPTLPEKAKLQDYQRYVQQMERERGFANQTVVEKCLLLGEELGELFKAVRKHENLVMDPKSHVGNAAEELADVMIYVCAIANRLDVDLEKAFREKEEKNRSRTWGDVM